jgi:hypothetical protein
MAVASCEHTRTYGVCSRCSEDQERYSRLEAENRRQKIRDGAATLRSAAAILKAGGHEYLAMQVLEVARGA